MKLMKKDFSVEANKLIGYLGGKDNIINAECNMSRFKVILKDVSIVDKDAIQKLLELINEFTKYTKIRSSQTRKIKNNCAFRVNTHYELARFCANFSKFYGFLVRASVDLKQHFHYNIVHNGRL